MELFGKKQLHISEWLSACFPLDKGQCKVISRSTNLSVLNVGVDVFKGNNKDIREALND